MIANNQTARTYNTLQQSIDWSTADPLGQLAVLRCMLMLLQAAKPETPIFINDEILPSVTRWTCRDVTDFIVARINRIQAHKQ